MSRTRIIGGIVLKLLKEGILTTTDLFVNIAIAPLRHPYKGVSALLPNEDFSIREVLSAIKDERKKRRQFYNLLVSLKRDGLINSSDKKGAWSITKEGIIEIKKFEKQPEQRYPKHELKEVIVISYDIPEKYRVHRNWLRGVLKFLDFKLLHQSVWIGKTEIPETLLMDFKERQIIKFMHIFSIDKKGSLTQIK